MPGAVFLDSAHPFSTEGRYDILAADPTFQLSFNPYATGQAADVDAFFKELRKAHNEFCGSVVNPSEDIPFCGGLLGYLSYDTGRVLEGLAPSGNLETGLVESNIGFYPWCILQDHLLRRCLFVALPHCKKSARKRVLDLLREPLLDSTHEMDFTLIQPFQAELQESEYRGALAQIQQYIRAGDCYQVNFAQRFSSNYLGDPWLAYLHLRKVAAVSYSAFIDLGEKALLSVSPEQFVRLRGNRVETRPIKGTNPRGKSAEIDKILADQLRNSSKDRAENLMIVDLLRNDLGKTCTPGSIRVDKLFELQQLPNVHHLVSTISGDLLEGKTALDLLQTCFPGGSITGAPKHRAMQIIDELEHDTRGSYCGSVVYISADGNMDSNIAIRTLQCNDGEISCWGGGGIVSDSDWQLEYRETHDKVGNLLRALQDQFGATGN